VKVSRSAGAVATASITNALPVAPITATDGFHIGFHGVTAMPNSFRFAGEPQVNALP